MKRINVLLLAYRVAGLLGGLLSGAVAHAIPDGQHAATPTPGHTCIGGAGTPGIWSPGGKPATGAGVAQVPTGNLAAGGDSCREQPEAPAPASGTGGSQLCIDPFDSRQCISVRLGTRIGNDRDILGAVDGLRVDYSMNDSLKLQGVAGFPVSATGERVDPARKVLGISAATNRPARPWDMNAFLLEQQEDGNTENRSLGGIVHYRQPDWSWLVYLDYDVARNSWGATTASGAWKSPSGTTFSATLDRRNRPLPDRHLTYLQQPRAMLKGWYLDLPLDRMEEYIRDGSSEVSTLAVGLSQALSRRVHLRGELSVLDAVDDTDTDAGKPAHATEYVYHTRLSGNNLLLPGDHNHLDVRYNLSGTRHDSSVAFDARYALNPSWNVIPVLRCDHHGAGPDSPASWVISPVLKMEYRHSRQSGLQISAGGAWSRGSSAETIDSRGSYFVSLAYQSKF